MRHLSLAALLALPAAGLAQETTTTVIMGRVTGAGGAALPHATVTINGRNAQFTDSVGRFQVEGIAAGEVTLRARRVGFSPVEQKVRIGRGDTVRATLAMSRVAIALPAGDSAARVCNDPGAPGRRSAPVLLQLYEQLQENAETFRLLNIAHPYAYASQRQYVTTLNDSVTERTPLEVLAAASARSWSYAAGKLVSEKSTATSLPLPALATFAEETFVKAHCFYYGGVVEVDGQAMARLDFAPDARLREADVSGSIYLDTRTFQIRRSDVELSKIPGHLAGQLTGYSVKTWFAEAGPGIPIVGAVRAEARMRRNGEVVTEMQQVVQVNFVNGKPE